MSFDCVVCGTACVDLVLNPFPLDAAIGSDQTLRLENVRAATGGIVPNAGNAMSRLSLRVAALTLVGNDHWSRFLVDDLQQNGVDTARIESRDGTSTSVTTVLVDARGEHSFAYHAGVMDQMNGKWLRGHLDLFATSRLALVGYYGLNDEFDNDLCDVLPEIRSTGCRVALDVAGGGGKLQPLDRILPHLDYYVPSFNEAKSQTGVADPRRMIEIFRRCGAAGLLGIKLGSQGAFLSPQTDTFISIQPIAPPGPFVDSTGAGDSFYAGLLTGISRGMTIVDAGKLAAAAGACCVTAFAGTSGVRGFEETMRLAGIRDEFEKKQPRSGDSA